MITLKKIVSNKKLLLLLQPIIIGAILLAAYVPTAFAATRWQTTQGSIVPGDLASGRFKFIDQTQIRDKVTNETYVSTAKPNEIFYDKSGSLFRSDLDIWYWPKSLMDANKVTDQNNLPKKSNGECYGAIVVETYKKGFTDAQQKHVEAAFELVQPIKNSSNKCVVYDDDGRPARALGIGGQPKGGEISEANNQQQKFVISWDKFSSPDKVRFATPLYWEPNQNGDQIGVWTKERKLRRISGGERDLVVEMTQKKDGKARDYTYFTTQMCAGSFDKPEAWVAVDWRTGGGTDRDLAKVFHRRGDDINYEWDGGQLECLFGRNIEQGPRIAIGGSSKTPDIGIAYPDNAASLAEREEQAAQDKADAVRAVLNTNFATLTLCWKATYGRDVRLNGRDGDFRTQQDMVNRYADLFIGTSTTTDAKIKAVMDCVNKNIGPQLAEALNRDYTEQDTPVDNTGGDDESSGDPSKCQVQGVLGWIVNPICDGAVRATEAMGTFVTNALKIAPLTETTDSGGDSPIYSVWQIFRGIANSFFVLIFLVVIFQQVLPIDIDAYTIKKMLPRLIVAVIGVQLSFFICQILVDISNVLGTGVATIFNQAMEAVNLTTAVSDSATNWASGITAGLTLTAAAILLIGPTLALLLAGFIAVLTVIITVEMRQIIIIFLIIASPVAILASVLPNTEQYFKKWWDMFLKLLLMYPLIQFILSGSLVAREVMSAAFTTSATTTDADSLQQIFVNFIPVVAFFMIPATFKASGGILGAIANSGFGRAGRMKGKAGSLVKSGYVDPAKSALKDGARTFGARQLDGDKRSQRILGRALTGTMLSVGKGGAKKRAALVESVRDDYNKTAFAQFKELGMENSDVGAMTEAALRGDDYTYVDADGNSHTIKTDERMAEAGLSFLAANGGQLELGKLAAPYYDVKGSKWKSQKARGMFRRATSPYGAAVNSKVPHLLHGKGSDIYTEMNAESMAGLNGGAADAFEQRAFESSEAIDNTLNNLVQVSRSTDLSGKMDAGIAGIILRNKAKFAGKTLEVTDPSSGKKVKMRAEDWIDQTINGTIKGGKQLGKINTTGAEIRIL